jgi:hypothetical protein
MIDHMVDSVLLYITRLLKTERKHPFKEDWWKLLTSESVVEQSVDSIDQKSNLSIDDVASDIRAGYANQFGGSYL